MEYIFGTVTIDGVTAENLKTVGKSHSNMEGSIQTVREYEDSTITDHCRVEEHYLSGEDVDGNCYDWYIISGHYRYIDRTKKLVEQHIESEQEATGFDLAMIEAGQAITELELMILGG